jgi:hypothetical protein
MEWNRMRVLLWLGLILPPSIIFLIFAVNKDSKISILKFNLDWIDDYAPYLILFYFGFPFIVGIYGVYHLNIKNHGLKLTGDGKVLDKILTVLSLVSPIWLYLLALFFVFRFGHFSFRP